jgi:hypothetical protein
LHYEQGDHDDEDLPDYDDDEEMMITSIITLMLVKAMEMMTLVLKMMVVCVDVFDLYAF